MKEVKMMFDRKSLHALNKKSKHEIVYMDASHKASKLTAADFDSEAEYEKWKCWLNEAYHEEEKQSHLYYDHTKPLEHLYDTCLRSESPEEKIMEQLTRKEMQEWCSALLEEIRGAMSEKQFRRMCLYYGEGLTEEEIASIEGISHQAVSKSIGAARNKAWEVLERRK